MKMKIGIRSGLKRPVCRLLWFCAALAGLVPLFADAAPPVSVPAIIQRNYDSARLRHAANADDDQAAWQLGRACFDRAEFSRDNAERASLANEGIDVCRKVVAHQPTLAAGHYYLAMNLAQLARTKMLGALPLLGQMESEWKTALTLDERMDYAGPDRYLGLLYREAPGWPISVGDAVLARRHLLRALKLSPNFPENHLNLIESYFAWNETNAAARAVERLRQLLPAAHKEFSGEYWEESWKDWNPRLEYIQAILKQPPNTPFPRHK